MEALLGVLLGFVVGQTVKFFFEPVYRLREAIGQVDYVLGYYAEVYMNPRARISYPAEARDALRRAAFELRVKAAAVPGLRFFSKIRLTPSERLLIEASRNLIGLSNNLSGHQTERQYNEQRYNQIIQALGLHEWDNKAASGVVDK
jgi:hypothetical protein